MATAKKEIGDKQCIGGNMPAGLLLTGKPQAVKDYCKELIDICGKGGGYVMAFGTAVDEGNAENFHAMFDYTKEYGVY
jgi:uroporphyrinogen-III decarboxylase